MSQVLPEQYRQVGALFSALEAIRNIRAVILLALTFVAAVGVFLLLNSMHNNTVTLLGMLLATAIMFYGTSAVGIMLMHKAQSGEDLSIGDAVMRSLAISHRLLAVALLAFVVFLGFLLVAAILFFVCKIPGVGPVLYFFALPISILALGVTYAAFLFVVMPLAGPSVWSGEKVFDVVSNLYAIVRQRLPLTVVLMVFLGILVAISAVILAIIFWSGVIFSGVLSASILHTGLGGGLSSLLGSAMSGGMGGMGGQDAMGWSGGMGGMGGAYGMGGMGGGSGSGLAIAGMAGAGLLFAAMMAFPGLVLFQGYCQIYLIVTDGLDVSAEKESLRHGMEQAKKAAEEAKRKAEEARLRMEEQRKKAASARQATAAAPTAAKTSGTQASMRCPACGGAITAGDDFCGSCGHKLK